jgi:glucokinase
LAGIAKAVEAAVGAAKVSLEDIQGVGIGIPGLVDPEKGIGVASVNLGWKNVPVKAELETRLGLACSIENDVNAATLGEVRYGAGRGRQYLVYLSIGTGIAAGIYLHGRLYHGPNGMAGEIGHAVIDPDGIQCKCGTRGCLEALASGPAIAARAKVKYSAAQGASPGQLTLIDKQEFSAETVFKAAFEGDDLALETVAEVSADLALAIQFLALAYDPEVIILGGGIAQGGTLLLEAIRSRLRRQAEESWVLGKVYHPEFLQVSNLGQNTGILGAAALVSSQP